MTAMSLVRKAHKWLALIVGLQLLIWLITGLLFTFVDSAKSRGKVYRAQPTLEQEPVMPSQLLTLTEISAKIPEYIEKQSIRNIELIAFQQAWYFKIVTFDRRFLLSATTGELFSVKEVLANELIEASYQGPGKLTNLTLVTPDMAISNNTFANVWLANFDDELNTQVHLSQATGRILKHSNDVSRYNDFLKLLHFMDYNQTGHFNDWWIVIMAILVTLLSISGSCWLINTYAKKLKKRWLNAF